MVTVACHSVFYNRSLCPHISTANVHFNEFNFNESLASVTSSILDPHWRFLVILLLPCVMVILQLWNSQTVPVMHPYLLKMVLILGRASLELWMWAWVVAKLLSMPTLPYLKHLGKLSSTAPARPPRASCAEGRVSSLALLLSGQA